MLTSRDPLNRTLLLVFAGIASLALLIFAIASLMRAMNPPSQPTQTPNTLVTTNNPQAPSAIPAAAPITPGNPNAKRFTLRLGQAFRFKDGVVVTQKPDDRPDVVFKVVLPQPGGVALRYDVTSKQLKTHVDPTLSSPAAILLSTHINTFEARPSLSSTTTGDVAAYSNQVAIAPKTRYVLLMNGAGDHYLLELDELEAPPGKYDDWRIGFTYEPVTLPVGLAGGKINKPLPGKLIFRDWYRSKMILSVDLTTGNEEVIADGTLPSTFGDRRLAYADSANAYLIRDAAGKVLHTIRFNDHVLNPIPSPDGTRVLGSVKRVTKGIQLNVYIAGPEVPAVGVFDLAGQEITSVVGYDDATWTPDGKIIATGSYNDPGLFEIDPATKNVRPIDAKITCPAQPNVSPDGKTIAFVTGNKVWLIDRDGTNMRQPFQDGHNQQRPAFSPDGTKLAVIICNMFTIDSTGQVFVVDLKTQEITPLRTSTGTDLLPDTSTRLNWIP